MFSYFAVKKIIIPLFILFFIASPFYAQFSQKNNEYTVKAVFLELFTRYIEWPSSRTQTVETNKPFIIGVAGETPLTAVLKEVYANQKIKNKEVLIQPAVEQSQIIKCDMLFISESEETRLPEILSVVKNLPILTICDTKDFAKKGVHISLYIYNDQIRFIINPKAVKNSKLIISNLLLKEAKIVNTAE